MNDRFRFRVWYTPICSCEDDEKPHYVYDVEQIYDGYTNKGHCELGWVSSFGSLLDSDEYIIEQCTGLKDKNGKLIYEGDICRIKGTYYDCDYKEYFEVDDIEKVESLEKFFGEAMVKGVYSALGCDTLQVEVIGNIHENADLLEAKDD